MNNKISEESKNFFQEFMKVRDGLSIESGTYNLEDAVRIAFDRFNNHKNKELDQLLMETGQVFHGFINEEFWSEYDESIKNRILEYRKRYTYEEPIVPNNSEEIARYEFEKVGDDKLFPNHTDKDIWISGFKAGYNYGKETN